MFLVTVLALSAYGKSLLEDIPPPKLDHKPPLSGGRTIGKLSLDKSILNLLSRKSVKKLLSKAVLKQWTIPKLSFTDLNYGGSRNNLLENTLKQSKIKQKEETAAVDRKGGFAFPKLTASALKSTNKASGGPRSKTRPSGGTFRFLVERPKPTWLMSTGDLQAETCFTVLHNETISSKGCEPAIRLNRLCTGRCNSFFVPGSDADFKSCASCFPSRVREEYVPLRCPKTKVGFKVKKIRVILECRCQSMMSC